MLKVGAREEYGTGGLMLSDEGCVLMVESTLSM